MAAHFEILQYIGKHITSTLVVLANLMVLRCWVQVQEEHERKLAAIALPADEGMLQRSHDSAVLRALARFDAEKFGNMGQSGAGPLRESLSVLLAKQLECVHLHSCYNASGNRDLWSGSLVMISRNAMLEQLCHAAAAALPGLNLDRCTSVSHGLVMQALPGLAYCVCSIAPACKAMNCRQLAQPSEGLCEITSC